MNINKNEQSYKGTTGETVGVYPTTSTAFCSDPEGKFSASDQISALFREVQLLKDQLYRRELYPLKTLASDVSLSEFTCYIKNNTIYFMGIIYVSGNKNKDDKLVDTGYLLKLMPSSLSDIAFFDVRHTGYTSKEGGEAIALRKDGFYAATSIDYTGKGRAYASVTLALPVFVPYADYPDFSE